MYDLGRAPQKTLEGMVQYQQVRKGRAARSPEWLSREHPQSQEKLGLGVNIVAGQILAPVEISSFFGVPLLK